MRDQLYRFIFEKFGIRGEIVALGASWGAVVERHDYAPTVRDYLGQTLVAATLMSGTIKFKGSLILQLQGEGALRTLVAQTTDQRSIRGMALGNSVPAGATLQQAMAPGRMVITAESAAGERYQGIVGIEHDTLAEAIEAYFAQSEQLQSRIWLAAGEQVAAGIFLQRMPGEHSEYEDWRRVCILADTLERDELLELAPTEVLHRLFNEEDVRLYDPEPVAFRCSCSRERIENTLRGMGREEVDAILLEQGSIEADCEFCNAHYHFDAVDVEGLFSDKNVVQSHESEQ